MFESIVSNIICEEFDQQFGRDSKIAKLHAAGSARSKAMVVNFSLSPDHEVEEGYRHLTILIFGGGSNYISVFARLDWNVVALKDLDYDEQLEEEFVRAGRDYVQGSTPWVLIANHDYDDGVYNLLRRYRERITSIDSLFHGWYQTMDVSPNEQEEFRKMLEEWHTAQSRPKLEELEFQFTKKASI